MKTLLAAAALAFCVPPTAIAAVPEFGTRQSDLACTGLLRVAVRGAMAAKPQAPEVVVATTAAYSLYIRRLSKAEPPVAQADIAKAVDQLTLEEKNAQVNTCMKKAADIMAPHVR